MMRIRRLGLRRYGRFTDASIDFGKRIDGAADLHIVYGPNEAGKSTAMSACMDLFYGIHPKSRFDFLHPYPTMRIEADVEQAGAVRQLARIKRPQNSLLEDGDNPIPDAVLLGAMGGLDRAAYQTMFCLDDETLEAGGESILASKGDLGQLLFSATAGLAELSHRLDAAQAEADAFFRPGRRSGLLTDLKKELVGLKDARDQIDTLASEFARLVNERDQAAKSYEEILARRGSTQARIDEVGRSLAALPRLVAYRGLRRELEPLASLPMAPSGWADDVPGLMTRQTQLATQMQVVAADIDELQGRLKNFAVNTAAQGLEARLDVLAGLRIRHVAAEKDLPDRRLSLALAEQAAAQLLTLIDQADEPNPETLILPTPITVPLRDLIASRSGIEAAVAGAEAEVAKARETFAEAEARVGADHNDRDEMATRALSAAIEIARDGNDVGRLKAADRIRQERADEFADRMLELHPWRGDKDTLLAMRVPTAQALEDWGSRQADCIWNAEIQRGETDRLEADLARLDSRIRALGLAEGVISDKATADVRAAREAAWANHRNTLDEASASVFEAAMRKLDLVTEQRLGHSASVAELNRALLDHAEATTALARVRRLSENISAQRAAIADEITWAMQSISGGAEETTDLAGMKLWLANRGRAIEARGKLVAAEREHAAARSDVDASRERMAEALRTAGVTIGDNDNILTLVSAGQAAIDRDVEAKALRAAVEDRRRDVSLREKKLAQVRLAEQDWDVAWQGACSACWLGDGAEGPATSTVAETLETLSQLSSLLKEKAGLVDRISKMERDQSLFRSDAAELAAHIRLDPRPSDALDLCQAIMDAVSEATTTAERRRETEARLAAAEDKARELAEAKALVDAVTLEMTNFFDVASLAEVDECLRAVALRTGLAERLAEARIEILNAMRLPTIEEAEANLDTLDRGLLEEELVALKARLNDEDQRSRDLFAAKTKAEDRIGAVGGDAAVAVIDAKRRTVLLTIEDKALTYLRLRLGAAAADKALRAYRDRHRSSMMARASESFTLISRGAYSGLTTQPSDDTELLIAKGADGSTKVASELSKGTRFQLYLALRVAGYHEFARAHGPAPFLADDIMETFDDFRAEEAFRLLAGMARTGQVVYFTHHRHLCEIAKTVEPAVAIHDLQSGRRSLHNELS